LRGRERAQAGEALGEDRAKALFEVWVIGCGAGVEVQWLHSSLWAVSLEHAR
jgi:hypothetical protein